MACEEARSLLDALMGGDRNARLPKGAARPSQKRHRSSQGGDMLLLPGKRSKSVHDNDIDPLYTAWGVDVYELFVNTKSDLGANPYIADAAAHQEYLQLPAAEKERLGFDYFLFQKLQDLVRQCDRTIQRQKEKLNHEIQRKMTTQGGGGGGRHAISVQDIDETAVATLVRNMIQVQEWEKELETKGNELDEVVAKEEESKRLLEPFLEAEKAKHELQKEKEKEGSAHEPKDDETATKDEDEDGVENDSIKEEDDQETSVVKEEPTDDADNDSEEDAQKQKLQLELGTVTLQKQRLVYEMAQLVTQLAPMLNTVDYQRRNLDYVKSDISTDKTVCEVSGNFMSARDADERIAAHYAGKQYVGWKMVREKLVELKEKYGRFGPQPPRRAGVPSGGPPSGARGSYGRNVGAGYGGRGRGGRGRFNDGFRGGSGPPDRGQWERGAPSGGYRGRGGGGGGWRR